MAAQWDRLAEHKALEIICSAAHSSVVSRPVAACFSAASTCCHVDFTRVSFGRCPSSVRTSASMTRSMMSGIVSARGRGT